MVLSVNDIASIKTPITIKKFFSFKIKSKNARSGITLEFKEYDISPEYPIQKTIKKIITDE